MNDKKTSTIQCRSMTLNEYSSQVFKESSVGMVSSLAHTSSKRRRFFKALFLILCLGGFFYQSIEFLTAFLKFPTAVDLEIQRPEVFDLPAYTFCNNGIKRSLFCEKYPERCEEATVEFCEKYGSYCGENKTLIPKIEYIRTDDNITFEELKELSESLEDFLVYTESKSFYVEPSGPYLRTKNINSIGRMLCYTVNDRVDSPLLPLQTKKDVFGYYSPEHMFHFHVDEDEAFLPGNKAGVFFSIHSPFEGSNPFDKGIFMRPGMTYMIFVAMEEELLLQRPYETDCFNYTQRWENNNRRGPRLQHMCRHQCYIEVSMRCYNCVIPMILYPNEYTVCTYDEMNYDCLEAEEWLKECDKCKDDCRRSKYFIDVQERLTVKYNEKGEIREEMDQRVIVEVYLEEDEVIVFKHSPKYMTVELFSTVGGFIGCWLGISLLDITDILEGFIRIFRYSLKKA